MKSLAWMSIVGCVLLLSSCATNETVEESQVVKDVKNGLVVRDFLVAISQVFDPITTTVQFNAPVTDFGLELERGLREMGYGMQRVTSDHGPTFLSYSKTISENNRSIATARYNLYVGDIGLERTYAVLDGGGIAPNGPMTITGTEKHIVLNGDLFPGQSVELEYAKAEDIQLEPDSITVIDFEVMDAISKLRTTTLPSYKALNSQNQEIENLFNQGASNFESIDKNYRTVRKDIIVFDDDSLELKTQGRGQIEKLLKFFNPTTDVIRLIGCSLGTTNHDGGNEQLALGRSKRVAGELIARSVSVDAIFDEGCWAPQAGVVDYPARAVVVQLQRKG